MIRHYGTLKKVAEMEAARSKNTVMSSDEKDKYDKEREEYKNKRHIDLNMQDSCK
jgi:hypothetical protein